MSKLFRFLILPFLVLALSTPAWADDINIIFDPVSVTPEPFDGAYLLTQQGQDYSVMWGSCDPTVNTSLTFATTLTGYISANNNGGATPSGCMALINATGAAITEVDLTITAPVGIPGETSTLCQSLDAFLINATCTGVLSSDGSMVSVTFNGGLAIPASTQNSVSIFYLGELGVNPNDVTVDAAVPTYDPSTLVLLLAGMTMLATYGVRRYA